MLLQLLNTIVLLKWIHDSMSSNQWSLSPIPCPSGMGETGALERIAAITTWVQEVTTDTLKQQENTEDEKKSPGLQKSVTLPCAVKNSRGVFRWTNSKAHLQILQCTSEFRGSGHENIWWMETGTENISDQLLASNREKQKRETCSAAAFQTVHHKSCCFFQVLVFLFSQGKEIKKTWKGSCVSYGHVGNRKFHHGQISWLKITGYQVSKFLKMFEYFSHFIMIRRE